MNMPCPSKSPCIDDASALGNYSSEAPDRPLFRAAYFRNAIWDDDLDIWVACAGQCVSEVSQEAADLCAQNNAKICESEKMFGNQEHTCYQTCDSIQRSYTVPAGTFWDPSQAQANALAVQWCEQSLDQICADPTNPFTPALPPARTKPACNEQLTVEVACFEGGKGFVYPACQVWGSSKDAANSKARSLAEQELTDTIGCLTEFGKSVCVNSPVSKFIVPNRISGFIPPITWEVLGAVPPGLVFTPQGFFMHIGGTFDVAGRWGFRLTLTDSVGTFTYRNYIVEAMEIIEPAVLPNGDQDQAYSHVISVDHGWDPKTFAIRSDSTLPTGLTLNGTTGEISGVPDGFGTYTFWVVVTDNEGARCDKEFTLTINPNLFSTIPWGLFAGPIPPGTAYATGGGEHVLIGASTIPVAGGGGSAFADAPFWVCNNTTGRVLNCNMRIKVAYVNRVPPNPHGMQTAFADGFGLTMTGPGPGITYASGGSMADGNHDFPFVIPMGVSFWSILVSTGAGASGPPFSGGRTDWELILDIL